MKTARTLSLCLAFSTATLGGLWIHSRALQADSPAPVPNRNASLAGILDRQAAQRSRQKELYGELSRLRLDLEELNRAKAASEAQILSLQQELKDPDVLPDYFAKRFAGIPGQKNKFSRLLSPAGSIHAENAEYSSRSGSLLNFKTPGGRIAVTASQIHPVILTELGFTIDQLRADQRSVLSRRDAYQEYTLALAQTRQLALAASDRLSKKQPALSPVSNKRPSKRLNLPQRASDLTAGQMAQLATQQAGFDAAKRARYEAEQRRNARVILNMGGISGPSVLQTGGRCAAPGQQAGGGSSPQQ